MDIIKLGTRRSLLAWAQSGWVAREVERLNPGVKVELVGIDTRGDKILDVSLRNVTGKEFFVAELDDALTEKRVDFTVHSMKDLSLDRPEAFVLGAIPKRANPRDVILFGPNAEAKLRAGKALKIGTSSPRRLENIPGFLKRALPRFNQNGQPAEAQVELVEIRGNVNTRLGRVHEPGGSERALDGVVLAFAGLIRLWADDKGRAELAHLLRGVRWMIMPLRECPAAPAQGALAVECRRDDSKMRDRLARLHDAETASRVARERQLLADWGGGCHQRFGATAVPQRELGDILFIRGRKPATADQSEGEYVEEMRWNVPAPGKGATWNGFEHRSKEEGGVGFPVDLSGCSAVFVAHSRALPGGSLLPGDARVWTSGVASWYKLASCGVWVEGCAEGMGFELARPIVAEPVLRLPQFGPEWTVLTHDRAEEGWGGAKVLATYRVPRVEDVGAPEGLETARHLYWGSGTQFDRWSKFVSREARHYCGPGKTAAHLRACGIQPIVFPSPEEWKKWRDLTHG